MDFCTFTSPGKTHLETFLGENCNTVMSSCETYQECFEAFIDSQLYPTLFIIILFSIAIPIMGIGPTVKNIVVFVYLVSVLTIVWFKMTRSKLLETFQQEYESMLALARADLGQKMIQVHQYIHGKSFDPFNSTFMSGDNFLEKDSPRLQDANIEPLREDMRHVINTFNDKSIQTFGHDQHDQFVASVGGLWYDDNDNGTITIYHKTSAATVAVHV